MRSLLRFMMSTSLTLCAMFMVATLFAPPSSGGEEFFAFDCNTSCGCVEDPNDVATPKRQFCSSTTLTTCDNKCQCVRSLNTGNLNCGAKQT